MNPYPLQWPYGWPKTVLHEAWSTSKLETLASERDTLLKELERLGATKVVITSNGQVGASGQLLAKQAKLREPGVTVFFRLGTFDYAIASDRYDSLAGNLRALGSTVNCLRTISRHHSPYLLRHLLSPLCWRACSARPEPGAHSSADNTRSAGSGQRKKGQQKPPPKQEQARRPPPTPKATPWRVMLGDLGKVLTWETVKKNYRKLAMELHPDKGGTTTGFQDLQRAYEEAKQFFNQS
ncbi:DnaJ domain-containing protein [uncultured Fibrella sp.]|uniref:DnaJ domain-containing protein n=1 Tax=uncultured Fibrella sp. TaxID=1284596 RepID=UPI0035CBCE6E